MMISPTAAGVVLAPVIGPKGAKKFGFLCIVKPSMLDSTMHKNSAGVVWPFTVSGLTVL